MSKWIKVVDVVEKDAQASYDNWEAAKDGAEIDGGGTSKWRRDRLDEITALADECGKAYAEALACIESGDLEGAETHLSRASCLESEGGDNSDSHHALQAVRAAMSDNSRKAG